MLDWQDFGPQEWAAFAGAENFPGGAEPQWAELTVDGRPAMAIFDANGVELAWDVEGDAIALSFGTAAVTKLRPAMKLAELRAMPGVKGGLGLYGS